jgi:PTH1 family peptidyl-tRNA hydrolase
MSDSTAQVIRLVAGLGNPGREYDGTRHNVGFAVLDRIASKFGVSFVKESKWDAFIARVTLYPGLELVLLKPTTFMNLSGDSVGEYARFYRIPSTATLVVLDDVALPLGALRLRTEGGSGGQKGLGSVLIHFATEQVPRLRVGVGEASDNRDLSAHVLSRFSSEEQNNASEAIERAAAAVLCAAREGMIPAMNLYNAARNSDKSLPQQDTIAIQP